MSEEKWREREKQIHNSVEGEGGYGGFVAFQMLRLIIDILISIFSLLNRRIDD